MSISPNVTLTPAPPPVPGVPVSATAEHEILGQIVAAFERLDRDAQGRVATWVADRYGALT
jgi:hypothetical protein